MIENFSKQYLTDRHNSDSVKWDLSSKTLPYDDLLPMGIADMDFRLSDEVLKPLRTEFTSGAYGYRYLKEDYYDVLIDWYKRHRDVTIEKEDVFFADGAIHALYTLFYSYFKPGAKIISFEPGYPRFKTAVESCGLELISHDLRFQNYYFYIDFDKLEEDLSTQNIEAIILCSPHNPTGRIWRKDELARLLKLCQMYQTYLICDEVHMDVIIDENKAVSALKVAKELDLEDIVVTIHSVGKTFNISGIKHAHIITTNPNIKKALSEYQASHYYTIKSYAALPTYYVYKYGDEWLKAMRHAVSHNYHVIDAALSDRFAYPPLEATYLMFFNLKDYCGDEDAYEYLLRTAHIQGNPGINYGRLGKSWVRLNIATGEENIYDFISRMKNLSKIETL